MPAAPGPSLLGPPRSLQTGTLGALPAGSDARDLQQRRGSTARPIDWDVLFFPQGENVGETLRGYHRATSVTLNSFMFAQRKRLH